MRNSKLSEQNGKRTTLSLSISVEDKKALKKYAAEYEKTVAAVIHDWIQKNCNEVNVDGNKN